MGLATCVSVRAQYNLIGAQRLDTVNDQHAQFHLLFSSISLIFPMNRGGF
jgi:hypothetical protein